MTTLSNHQRDHTDLTVSAIIERDNRFLCIEEQGSLGVVVNVPGGHIDAGETPEQAVVREVLEETRWHFTPAGFVGAYLWDDLARKQTFMRLIYFGSVTHESPKRALDHGIVGVHWRTRDDIAADAHRLRAPVVLSAIDDYLLGQRASLQVNALCDHQRILDTLQPQVQRL